MSVSETNSNGVTGPTPRRGGDTTMTPGTTVPATGAIRFYVGTGETAVEALAIEADGTFRVHGHERTPNLLLHPAFRAWLQKAWGCDGGGNAIPRLPTGDGTITIATGNGADGEPSGAIEFCPPRGSDLPLLRFDCDHRLIRALLNDCQIAYDDAGDAFTAWLARALGSTTEGVNHTFTLPMAARRDVPDAEARKNRRAMVEGLSPTEPAYVALSLLSRVERLEAWILGQGVDDDGMVRG